MLLLWEDVRQGDLKVKSHCYDKVGKIPERDQRLLLQEGQ